MQEALATHPDLNPLVACCWVLLHGLRGDADAARSARAGIAVREESEDPQDLAWIEVSDAAVALAAGDAEATLRHARGALSHLDVLGVRSDSSRWSWHLAVRAARALGDTETLNELLALVDGHPVGHVPPVTRAEADLTRIYLAGDEMDPAAAGEIFERVITMLRELPASYYLAWALLDRGRDADIAEAAAIAERLGAAPLLQQTAARSSQPV
jgi:hypothetical protein